MDKLTQKDLAISTMWNYRKATSGRELMDQLMALGFYRFELNYQVKQEWLNDILRATQGGEVKIASVHNVFPKTQDERFGTDSVLLGYADSSLRKQAVELAKTSIEWACRLGAGAVVFHPTEVPLEPTAFDVPLKKMMADNQTHTEAFVSLRRRLLSERQSAPYITNTLKSLDELAKHVEKHHLPVKLGMENRSMCHQVPLFDEFELIVKHFDQSCVGIWLDTGHGIMMEELKLQSLPLSERVKRNLVGMHIHDAMDGLDHYAPYTLPVPVLDRYMPYIKASPIKVLELSGRLSADEIKLGTARLIEKYNA